MIKSEAFQAVGEYKSIVVASLPYKRWFSVARLLVVAPRKPSFEQIYLAKTSGLIKTEMTSCSRERLREITAHAHLPPGRHFRNRHLPTGVLDKCLLKTRKTQNLSSHRVHYITKAQCFRT